MYAFGEFIHYTDTQSAFNPEDLRNYLIENNHHQIDIHPTVATIEDVFMDLATSTQSV